MTGSGRQVVDGSSSILFQPQNYRHLTGLNVRLQDVLVTNYFTYLCTGFSYCWCTDCGSRQWFRNWAARFFGNGGQLYELAAMLIDKNTTSEQLRDLIETRYPDFVDADVVVSQFNVARRLQPWTDSSTLQQRARACLTKLGRITKNVPDHDCCTSN